jgi:hypothetical protein
MRTKHIVVAVAVLLLSVSPLAIKPISPASSPQLQSGGVLFDPAHQRPISLEQNGARITLLTNGDKLRVEIVKPGLNATRVDLPGEMLQVNDIRHSQSNKIVVIGMFSGDLWSIAIISTDQLALVDYFLCYEPAVSPDGHYIAFSKFFPPHGADGAEYHYMLYDLRKDAAHNRPSGISTSDWKTVGFTLYPFGIGNEEFDNIRRPESEVHMLSSDGFFWSPNSDQVVFADKYKGSITVVVANLALDSKVTIMAKEMPPMCGENTYETRDCPLRLTTVSFGVKSTEPISLTFGGIPWSLGGSRKLLLFLDQFDRLGRTTLSRQH